MEEKAQIYVYEGGRVEYREYWAWAMDRVTAAEFERCASYFYALAREGEGLVVIQGKKEDVAYENGTTLEWITSCLSSMGHQFA